MRKTSKPEFSYKDIESKKYKYELLEDYHIEIDYWPLKEVEDDFYSVSLVGLMVTKKGYQWDGASGPTIDSENTIRASCVHDVLCQMFRRKQLSLSFKWKLL